MREIPLTQGYVTIVDAADYERLARHKWRAQRNRNTVYAVRWGPMVNGKRGPMILMHREILGTPPGVKTDHEDGDGLNCRRYNLREATNRQNQYNQRPQVGRTSRFKGVHWHKRDEKWHARIKLDGKEQHLGRFTDEIEAALAYDAAATNIFGEFARINFMEAL